MKLPKKSKKELKQEMAAVSGDDMPDYPWGLSITLNKESIDKLPGLKSVKAGENVHITAKGYIRSVRMEETKDPNHGYQDVGIQITDIGVGTDDAETAFSEED